MFDEILHEKELRVIDARRKLAWFVEEEQELLSLPRIKEYIYLRDKKLTGLTPAEKARLDHLLTLPEPFQFINNEGTRSRVAREIFAALDDLEEYMRNNNIAQDSGPIQKGDKSPPSDASDSDSPKSVLPNEGSSETKSPGEALVESERLRHSPTAELRQRRRTGNHAHGGREYG